VFQEFPKEECRNTCDNCKAGLRSEKRDITSVAHDFVELGTLQALVLAILYSE
jgi:hypothetical protein